MPAKSEVAKRETKTGSIHRGQPAKYRFTIALVKFKPITIQKLYKSLTANSGSTTKYTLGLCIRFAFGVIGAVLIFLDCEAAKNANHRGDRHLAGLAGEYLRAQPGVSVTLHFSNRVVDVVDEGFDLALRVAPALDSSLVARKLASSRLLALAAPAYLERRGRPRRPAELAQHDCLCFGVPAAMDEWRFARRGAVQSVKLAPRMVSSSSEALRAAACAGTGITLLPTFLAVEDLRAGRLVALFRDFDSGRLGIFAVYPHRKYLSAKVRGFLELLRSRYGDNPERDPWDR